jgi:alkanesulfonate monooxygenase SsuD/methylene tetrahydromethanopterin reductase-like flavin-dependent oxidoreductase (luciferase family)
LLSGTDLVALRSAAEEARQAGLDVVFVADGPLGDAAVLAAALGAWVPDLLFGVSAMLQGHAHRHPTVLARELTALDQVTGGRAVLAFSGSIADAPEGADAGTHAIAEAIGLCRGMWRDGIAVSDGPAYPVAGAINRPQPVRPGGPLIALDLTGGAGADGGLIALCDLVMVPAGTEAPAVLCPGVDVCYVRELVGGPG